MNDVVRSTIKDLKEQCRRESFLRYENTNLKICDLCLESEEEKEKEKDDEAEHKRDEERQISPSGQKTTSTLRWLTLNPAEKAEENVLVEEICGFHHSQLKEVEI